MKNIRFAAIYILILTSIGTITAKTPSFARQYIRSYPQTALLAIQKPPKWNSNDCIKAGSIIVIGGGLYLFDEDINALIKRNRSPFTHDLAKTGNVFGEGKYMLPALGATFLTGYILHSPKTQDTALLSLKSFLLANATSVSLKYLTQRNRPFSNVGNQLWNGDGFSKKRESFPSGHTTIVWSIAPILAEQYKDHKWVAPVVYSVAVLTPYARMHDQKHWASDVFTGAVIGYFTSQLVLESTPRLYIAPSPDSKGLEIVWKF